MKPSLLKPVCVLIAVLGVAAPAVAETPTWMLYFERTSGWADDAGLVVDSTGLVVTLEETRWLKMPRCARLSGAELGQVAKHVAWLMKNVKVDEGESYGHCLDDPRVKVFIKTREHALPLGYPLDQNCRDVEPPLALRQLVDQLLALHAKPLERCGPASAE